MRINGFRQPKKYGYIYPLFDEPVPAASASPEVLRARDSEQEGNASQIRSPALSVSPLFPSGSPVNQSPPIPGGLFGRRNSLDDFDDSAGASLKVHMQSISNLFSKLEQSEIRAEAKLQALERELSAHKSDIANKTAEIARLQVQSTEKDDQINSLMQKGEVDARTIEDLKSSLEENISMVDELPKRIRRTVHK